MKYTTTQLDERNEEVNGRTGVQAWAVLLFADMGIGYSMEKDPTTGPGTAYPVQFYDVASGYVYLDGVLGFFVSSYCDPNGFEGCEFRPLQKAEAKRGPVPKGQKVIDGVRYYV